jgi:zinc protease
MNARRGRFLVVAGLGAMLLGLSCTPKTPTYTIKYAELRAKIDNGLRMVIIPDESTPMVHVAVRYEVGANEDPPGKAGLAHLVEHMMFQHRFLGPDKPATFEILPQIATGFNAWTNFDTTHYYLDGRKEDLDAMLRIEAARMGAICETIPPAEFEREREVVRNEIRQRQGTPEGQVPQLVLETVYPPGHAYNQMIGGNDAQLSSITFEDVCKFMTDYYTPSRATVVVAGNVDPEEVAKKVKFAFGGIKPRKPAPRKPVDPLPQLEYEKVVKEVDTERSQVWVIWKLPPRTSDDYPAGRSMIGAVNQRLAFFNDQYDFAASVGAGQFGGELAPIMVVVAELYNYNDVDDALDWIWKSTSQIHRGFEDGMFSDESAALGKAATITQLELLSSRATFVADQVQFENRVDFDGSEEYLFHALEQYDSLDGGKFRSFMRSRLKKSNAKVVVIKSSKSGIKGDQRSSLKYSTKTHDQEMKPVIDPAEAKHPLKAPQTDSILKKAVRYQLGNGMKVVLLPREGLPVVSARLMFDVGSAHEPEDKAGLASVAAGFLRAPRGATFGRVGIGVRGGASMDTTSFATRGINIYLDVMIKALERVIKAGEVWQESVERWQRFQKLQFDSEEYRRNQAYQLEVAKAIYGPDHPYTVKGSPTEKSYKRIGRDVAMDFIRKHYSAKNATLIVVGDFDVDKAKSVISGSFGEWDGGRDDEPIKAAPKPRTGPEYIGVLRSDERPQMQVSIAYPAPAGIDGQEAARQVLVTMLNRRMAAIRTKLGSTYGTYAFRRPSVGPAAYVMGGTVDADRAGESLKAMRDAIDSLRRGEDFDKDFAIARRMAMKRLLAESTDTGTLAARLGQIAIYDLPPDYYDQQVKFVAAVSPAQVRGLLESELDPSKEIIVNMATREVLEQAFTEANINSVRYVEPK